MALSLGPIRIAKRQWKKPWSSDPFGQDDHGDPEKRAFMDEDSEYDESVTSRETSTSLDPMLYETSLSRRMARAYDDRIPRKQFNKYFTLVLGSIVILFILFLTRLGHNARTKSAPPPAPKPAVYESFPFLKRYHGGIRTLIPRSQNKPEYPGDEEELREDLINSTTTGDAASPQRRQIPEEETKHNLPPMRPFDPFTHEDMERRECFLDMDSIIRVPRLHTYDGCVRGFPDNVIGSYDMLGIRNDVCFDRYGRLGPYGLGYGKKDGGTGVGLEGDTEDSEQVWFQDAEVDFRTVSWADAQARCADANKHRFGQDFKQSGLHPDKIIASRQVVDAFNALPGPVVPDEMPTKEGDLLRPDKINSTEAGTKVEASSSATESSQATQIPQASADLQVPERYNGKPGRTALVIRTWSDYQYDNEDIMFLRSLIAETAIASGSEYVVHFLIHERNNLLPIWTNETEYQIILNSSLPEEFAGMGTLWTDHQLKFLYPGMDERHFRDIHLHGSYRSLFMPMQYFAHQNPEFEHFWHWEMDIRYTGHFYHFFDRIGAWAKKQPRKGLWERNARFYVPSVHGSWEDFRQMVRVQTEHGTASKANMWSPSGLDSPANDPNNPSSTIEKPIWGPEPPPFDDIDTNGDPVPPTTYAKDNYEWGVGEEADLITFNPLFDPTDTDWNLEKDVTGYNISSGIYPPRRVAIVTASRLSRRLLLKMHTETSVQKHTMFSEMWPASCALHHGYKAVYAPHPVFIDRRWPTDYLAAVYNAGRNGASGGARTTPFNDAHQDNFLGVSWYYRAGFPANLWKRWLGYKVDGDGGPSHEVLNEGRMCLPGMLMHPVKHVDLVEEGDDADKENGNAI